MACIGIFTGPGITLTLSPMRLFICTGLLVVVLLARYFLLWRSHLTVRSARHGGEALFAPVVTSSYTPLLDIDYNLHKSNSTFFNDLYNNRTELMLALFKDVVKPGSQGKATIRAKMFNIGRTSCTFKKPIALFAKYEISSRSGSNNIGRTILGRQSEKPYDVHHDDCIYAPAVTKHVFKQGRQICSPESVMHECGLLSPRSTTGGPEGLTNRCSNIAQEFNGHWTGDNVQAERNKHLKVAQNFAALDGLQKTLIGRSGPVLYAY
ncbi:hypothetical protein FB567DRAFT_560440 [Paraphoma chrysanthemicola]|uniref:Capsule polysaccharide biosynthesis protein n=1 Tax=Paraphoma chrysanthemicola TaxID=798071 RepID=A0A8K0R6C4_9PLEO|nr:hypothetical protein FB567DRAFT_560440 [Paraphoma chrysanthemicola]